MTARTQSVSKQPTRRSPNRQRLIARVAVWTVFLSGAAIYIPFALLG